MIKVRLISVVAMVVLLLATPVWASTDREPIRIVNERNDVWQVKVWAYPGDATQARIFSCQTIHYSSRPIEVIHPVRAHPLDMLIADHCGNYDSVTFWFQVFNTETGVTRDYTTFGSPAPWGARWTWDGVNWTCSGCL